MKKIFAFVLAMLMVLSIVPASAFAAFGVACPSTHTRVNCENSYFATVPASCTEYGYDIYTCNKCGAEIFDNFVEPIDHDMISGADKNHTNQAATCTTDGWEWVIKCKVCSQSTSIPGVTPCDKTCGDANCTLLKRTIKAGHNYVLNGKGIGCEVQYQCTVCGDVAYKNADGEFVASASHVWNYDEAVVTTAPAWVNGVFNKGLADVVCSVEGCPAEKTVEITSMDCQHYAATIIKEYAEETCFVDGSKQIIECRDCKVYFVDVNKNGDIDAADTKLVDKDGKATKDLSYAVVNEIKRHKVPATGYISTENCIGVYECELCKTVQSETHHTGAVDVNDSGVDFPASCLNPGYDFMYCNDCRSNITVTIEPLGHETKTITVDPTCVNQGAKYTICVRPNCTLGKQQVIDASTTADKNPATLTGYGILANDIVSRGINAGYTYYLRITKTESVKAIDASKHTLKYTNLNDPTETSDKMLETDCTGYKIVQITCTYGCSANTIEFVNAADHDEYVAKKYANCNKPSANHSITIGGVTKNIPLAAFTERIIYACKDCNEVIRYEDKPISFATQYAKPEELKYYHGAIWYEADASYKLQVVERSYNATGVTAITVNNEPLYLIAPTCTAEGLETWVCGCCATRYYVTAAKVPHTPEKGRLPVASDYIGGKDATCTETGIWDSFKCAHCSNLVINNPYTGKQQTVSNLIINPHGSSLVKKTAPSTAKWCAGVAYYECEDCGATFADWAATTPFDTAKENHTWVVLQKAVYANCNTNGKYEIKYCSNYDCRRVEVNAFVYVEGKPYEINMYTGTRAKDNASKKTYKDLSINDKIATTDSKGKWSTKDFKITKAGKLSGDYGVALPMLDHKYPLKGSSLTGMVPSVLKPATDFTVDNRAEAVDHTTPGYDAMQCNYCEYEYFANYVAASGDHVNVSGQIIPEDCTDPSVKDRFCIYCDAIVDGNHEWTTAQPIKVAPTCSANGYECYICKLCGHREIITVYPKSDLYHESADFVNGTDGNKIEIGQQSNYAVVGSEYTIACALCKKNIGTAQKPEDIKTAGFEILLDADAKTFIPGSTVKVTVSLASLQGVSVWAIAFPVTYDAEVFEFVGYEWNTAESAFQTFAVTEVSGGYHVSGMFARAPFTDGIFQPAGLLSIVANADAGTLVKEEEVLVTLEFKVISAEAATAVFTVEDQTRTIGGVIGKTLLEVYGDQTNDFTGEKLKDDPMWVAMYGKYYQLLKTGTEKTFNVEALDEYGKAVAVNYNGMNSTDVLEVAAFLDLTPDNNNDDITLADAYVLYSLIYNNEYDVKADANFDGKVDGKDLSILYAVYSGVITVEQLIAPNAELPEDWYAGLGGR